MTLKYFEILARHGALMNGGKRKILELVLPPAITDTLTRNVMALGKEIQMFGRQQDALVARYAKKDDRGNPIIGERSKIAFETPDDEEAFNAERNEFLNVEVDVDIKMIPVKLFSECDASSRYDIPTPAERMILAWMVDYGEEGA